MTSVAQFTMPLPQFFVGDQILYLYRKTEAITEYRLGFILPRVRHLGAPRGPHTAMLLGNGAYVEHLREDQFKGRVGELSRDCDWCLFDGHEDIPA